MNGPCNITYTFPHVNEPHVIMLISRNGCVTLSNFRVKYPMGRIHSRSFSAVLII